MQTQTDTGVAESRNSLGDVLRRTYARNHESMEDFPVFAEQFQKVQSYIAKNPLDVEKRVYYAHLLSEIGATPLVVEQAVGLALSSEPIDAFLLYSLKVALKRTGQEKVIAQYEPFESEEVKKRERQAGPCEYKSIPLPKQHWWSKQEYETKKLMPRLATHGEIEFLAAQLNEQTW